MHIHLDVDSVEKAIDQLRKQSLALKAKRQFGGFASLATFSRASGLDEAGERLSPIGDERAPEANQAIALYLKQTADSLWLALTNTMQTDESFSGIMGSMLSPLHNNAAALTPMYSEAFQQLKAADPKTNTFDNAAVSSASESSLMSADFKLGSTNSSLAYSASDFWNSNANLIEDAMEELNGVHHSLSSSADTVWIAEAMKKVTQIQNAGLEYVANSRSLATHTEALGMVADAESLIASAAAAAYVAAETPEAKQLIESEYLSSYSDRMTAGLRPAIPSFNRLLPDAGKLPALPYASTDIPASAEASYTPTTLPQGLRETLTNRGLGDLAHATTPAEVLQQYGRPTPETFERIAAGAAPTQAASAVLAPPNPASAASFSTGGSATPTNPLTPANIGSFGPAGGAGASGAGAGASGGALGGVPTLGVGGAGTGARGNTQTALHGLGTGANPRAGAGGGNGVAAAGPALRGASGPVGVAGSGSAGSVTGNGRAGATGAPGSVGALRGGSAFGPGVAASAAGYGTAGTGSGSYGARPGFVGGAGVGSGGPAGGGLGSGAPGTPGAGSGGYGATTGTGAGGHGTGANPHGTNGTYAATGSAGANGQQAQGGRGAAVAAGPMGAAGAGRGRGRDKSGAKVRTVTSAVERDGNLKALLGDAPLLLPSVIGHNVRG